MIPNFDISYLLLSLSVLPISHLLLLPNIGNIPQDREKTKNEKDNTTEEWEWEYKENPMTKNKFTLEAEVLLVHLDHGSTPFDMFQMVTGMNELLEIILTDTLHTKVATLKTIEDEMKAFLGKNFILGINKLPFLEDYWSTDKCMGNEKIQNNEQNDKYKISVHLTESSLFQYRQ